MLSDMSLPYRILERICEMIGTYSIFELHSIFNEEKEIAKIFELAVNEITAYFNFNCFSSNSFIIIKK